MLIVVINKKQQQIKSDCGPSPTTLTSFLHRLVVLIVLLCFLKILPSPASLCCDRLVIVASTKVERVHFNPEVYSTVLFNPSQDLFPNLTK